MDPGVILSFRAIKARIERVMGSEIFSPRRRIKRASRTDRDFHMTKGRWETALCVGLAFLGSAFIFGLLSIAARILGFDSESAKNFELGLLFITYPVAFFVAHCLDKAKEARRALRREYLERKSIVTGDRATAKHDDCGDF
jgi:hypothetical protein